MEAEVKGKIYTQIVNGNVADTVKKYEETARTNQNGNDETFALNVGNDKKKKTVQGPQKIVSDDGNHHRKDDIFKRLHETIGKILKNPRLCDEFGNINKELPALLEDVLDMYEEFATIGQLSYYVVERYQQEVGQLLTKTKITAVLCRVIMDGLLSNKINDDGVLSIRTKTLHFALLILLNTADTSPEVTYDIAQEPKFLETLKDFLTSITSVQLAKEDDEEQPDREEEGTKEEEDGMLAEEEDDEEHVDGKEEKTEEEEDGMLTSLQKLLMVPPKNQLAEEEDDEEQVDDKQEVTDEEEDGMLTSLQKLLMVPSKNQLAEEEDDEEQVDDKQEVTDEEEDGMLTSLQKLLMVPPKNQLAEEEDDEEQVDDKQEVTDEEEDGMAKWTIKYKTETAVFIRQIFIERTEENDAEEITEYCLTIIHNISMVTAITQRLRDLEFVGVLLLYLDNKDEDICLNALSTLANIINEEESALLQDKQDVIEFLLKSLGLALKNRNHRWHGWSAQELALTIRCLARNDANKKLLVEMGSLPYLVTMAKCEKVEEQREAVEAMWVLAFDRDNKKRILEDKKLNIVDMLVDLMRCTKDKDVKKALDGTLWILREDIQSDEKYKNVVTFVETWKKRATSVEGRSRPMKQDTQDKNGHIMISYNWSHQNELKQIRDLLRENGYSVWMDIDDLFGSTLQAMAEAVELAHVVLICMSQKYKDSSNCRAEAEYAFQQQKKIIPLKMERDYKPDGWLGIIAGTKKYFEFNGKYQFDNIFEDLLREVAACFANSGLETIESQIVEDKVDSAPLSATPRAVSYPNHKMPVSALRQWTAEEVEQWLVKHNLPKKQLSQLTGKDLSALVKIKKEAPEFFYNYVFRELNIKDLSTIGTFTDALEDLTV